MEPHGVRLAMVLMDRSTRSPFIRISFTLLEISHIPVQLLSIGSLNGMDLAGRRSEAISSWGHPINLLPVLLRSHRMEHCTLEDSSGRSSRSPWPEWQNGMAPNGESSAKILESFEAS